MTERKKASRARARLRQAARKHESLIAALLGERGPVLRGTFQLRRTRCGKDNCKCAQGELHTTAALIVSEGGERRTFYLRTSKRAEAKRRAGRYRRFRKMRAELKKLDAEILVTADELLATLVEPLDSQHAGQDRHASESKRRRGKTKTKRNR